MTRDQQKAMFSRMRSYLDAERLGLKIDDIPLNSYVQGSGDDAKIVGYTQGSTFSSKGLRLIHPNIKKFTTFHEEAPDEELKIYAVNPVIAKKIAKDYWVDDNFKLLQHQETVREI